MADNTAKLSGTTLQLRRGLESNMPTRAAEGEPLITMGDGAWKMFVGAGPDKSPQLISSDPVIYTASFSNKTEVVVNHNLGSRSLFISVFDGDGIKIEPQKIQITSDNAIKLFFDVAQSGKVVISGDGVGTFAGIDFNSTDDIPEGENNRYLIPSSLATVMNQVMNQNRKISDWISIETGKSYYFDHNLNTQDYDVDFYVTDGTVTVKGCVNMTNDSSCGTSLVRATENQVKFSTGEYGIFSAVVDGTINKPSAGHLRIVCTRRNLTY